MNQTNKTVPHVLQVPQVPQPSIAEQRAEIESEMRLAKEYWLRTVQPHIEGRILRGVEFFVVTDAHRILQAARKKAEDWNRACPVPAAGVSPAAFVLVDLSSEDFREPEMPEMFFADNVKPEVLAAVAAPLVKEVMTPDEAIRNAHELLMAAERYIGTLPEKKDEIDSWHSDFEKAFSTVTFKEIAESNKKKSGQLPLLPPLQIKRKGKSEKELLDEPPLSVKAIRDEVRDFLRNGIPFMTLEDYEQAEEQNQLLADEGKLIGHGQPTSFQEWQQRNQDEIDDCLKNNGILLQSLCKMRWERFKKFWQGQQNRAITREANKKAASKTKKPKAILPKSAASSPITAGKRKQ
jgi:hypothetical protein